MEAIIELILGWIRKGASCDAIDERGRKVLCYGKELKIVGVVLSIFWIALSMLVFMGVIESTKEDILWVTALFAFLTTTGIAILIEAYFVKITYDDTGITVSSPWRRDTRIILWDEIESLRFNSTLQWYVCQTGTKGKIRLSVYLSGLGEFLGKLENKLAARARGDSLKWPGDKYIR